MSNLLFCLTKAVLYLFRITCIVLISYVLWMWRNSSRIQFTKHTPTLQNEVSKHVAFSVYNVLVYCISFIVIISEAAGPSVNCWTECHSVLAETSKKGFGEQSIEKNVDETSFQFKSVYFTYLFTFDFNAKLVVSVLLSLLNSVMKIVLLTTLL